MSNILHIPESLQFYFANAQQASAVNQMLEMDSLPTGLTWEEVEHYQVAKLSAKTIQLDYWLFSKKLWEATWGQVIQERKEVAPEFYEHEYSMESVWTTGFYKQFENHNSLWCYGATEDSGSLEDGLRLYFGQEAFKNLALSDGWEAYNDENGGRSTKKNLVEVQGKTEIDISPLVALAKEAMEEFREIVNSFV